MLLLLWVSLCKAKYLRHSTFLDSQAPRVATWAWKGLFRLFPPLRLGACKQIHNGEATLIWKDPWVVGLPNYLPLARTVIHDEWREARVSSLISPVSHR